MNFLTITNLIRKAMSGDVDNWRPILTALQNNHQPVLLDDNLDVWYYVNLKEGINGNRLVSQDPDYVKAAGPDAETFYFRFYDDQHQDAIPVVLTEQFSDIISYLKDHKFINGAALWFIGPNTIIPEHEDGYPLETILGNLKADAFWMDIGGMKSDIAVDDYIQFKNSVLHSTHNQTNTWWVLVQLHINSR
jgi:hypothetical protein